MSEKRTKAKVPGSRSLVLALFIGIISLGTLGYALAEQEGGAPQAEQFGDISRIGDTSSGGTGSDSTLASYSPPTQIDIPSIDVGSGLIQVDKAQNGMMEVPEGDDYNKAAWYKNSPAPGQPGASIIIGHVDSAEDGPSVFFELAAIKEGQEIKVQREDGKTAIFEVNAVRQYNRDNFPTESVYIGSGDASELRLITCGGAFSTTEGTYEDNVVVFARLKG